MTIVVFLRGANVGRHRRFRPALLAEELRQFDVVNVKSYWSVCRSATPARPKHFAPELVRRLPFDTQMALCEGMDVLALENCSPLQGITVDPEHVRFVSILIRSAPERLPDMPFRDSLKR